MVNGRQEILTEADQVMAAYQVARDRACALNTYGTGAQQLYDLAQLEVESLERRLAELETRATNYLAAVRKVGA